MVCSGNDQNLRSKIYQLFICGYGASDNSTKRHRTIQEATLTETLLILILSQVIATLILVLMDSIFYSYFKLSKSKIMHTFLVFIGLTFVFILILYVFEPHRADADDPGPLTPVS